MLKKIISRSRGSVLMETALAMPVLLVLIFGTLQFAHIWTARQMVAYAAFCATRAIMVVPPTEQSAAAQNAAEVALSWMNIADKEGADDEVTVPGWGKIPGSGTSEESDGVVTNGWNHLRVKAEIVEGYDGSVTNAAAVTVRFRFPLLFPAMSVDTNFAVKVGAKIDGWHYIELRETCVLPMPYSTAEFPTGAFSGVDIRQEGS